MTVTYESFLACRQISLLYVSQNDSSYVLISDDNILKIKSLPTRGDFNDTKQTAIENILVSGEKLPDKFRSQPNIHSCELYKKKKD